MQTPTLNISTDRDDYGRRVETYEANRTALAVVITLPNTTQRREQGLPTHLANDYSQAGEDAKEFYNIAAARAFAAFRAGVAAASMQPAEEETAESLGFLSGGIDDELLDAAEEAGIVTVDRSGRFPLVEVFADARYLTCTHECGGCVNGELCTAVVERALKADDTITAYGSKSVATCGHRGECAALAGR